MSEPNYACRINEPCERFASLLYIDGTPRRERFCPHCEPLQRGDCILRNARQARVLMRQLKLARPESVVCRMCHRPNPEPVFVTCPRCRKRARARMRKERKP